MTPPAGTVTFLFTDIEGSTSLWERHPEAVRPALARHDALADQIVAGNSGVLIKPSVNEEAPGPQFWGARGPCRVRFPRDRGFIGIGFIGMGRRGSLFSPTPPFSGAGGFSPPSLVPQNWGGGALFP